MNSQGIDVLYVVGQFGRGGTERQVALLATHLARLGRRVAIAVPAGRPVDPYARYETPGVEVFHPDRRFGRPLAFASLLNFVVARRPRVVHCFTFQLNFYAYLLARSCNAVALGGARSGFDKMREDTHRVVWRLCLRYPGVIAYNNRPAAQRTSLLKRPWAPRKTLVVSNAIDMERLARPVRHGPRACVRILGIGNLREEKRWHLAIDAVSRLAARGLNCTFTILGAGSLRAELERRIAELGAGHFITLPGSVERVEQHLLASDVLILTSGSEGSPNAVMEGMAAGLACVATSVGEVPFLLADERGVVVPKDDFSSLERGLERVCSDHELRQRLGAAARRYAETHLDVKACAAEWERIYAALEKRKR
jgi:glycosyltransferase involved in cell wall biosynthesis